MLSNKRFMTAVINMLQLLALSLPATALRSCVFVGCGEINPDVCSCDSQCSDFGDCCGDFEDYCVDGKVVERAAGSLETPGYCADLGCGKFHSGKCGCDSMCVEVGDCCPDAFETCLEPHSLHGQDHSSMGSCSGLCGQARSNGCKCDSQCTALNDCCEDFFDACASTMHIVESGFDQAPAMNTRESSNLFHQFWDSNALDFSILDLDSASGQVDVREFVTLVQKILGKQ